MAIKEELEIEIDATGKVTIHVLGVKGKSCVQTAQQVANIIGKVEEQNFTSDFYQPGTNVGITGTNYNKVRE